MDSRFSKATKRKMKKIFIIILFLTLTIYSCTSSIDWDNYAKAKPSKASIEDATKAN